MSAPKSIRDYAPEWSEMFIELEANRAWSCECGSKRNAQAMRLKYYGFRAAVRKRDPLSEDPWTKLLEGKSARILGTVLLIGPDPLDALLRRPAPLQPEIVSEAIPSGPSTEDVLTNMYVKPKS